MTHPSRKPAKTKSATATTNATPIPRQESAVMPLTFSPESA
jgi:hypothetical protein